MAAYRRVYDSRHLQADCQEPESAPEPYARYRVWATFLQYKAISQSEHVSEAWVERWAGVAKYDGVGADHGHKISP